MKRNCMHISCGLVFVGVPGYETRVISLPKSSDSETEGSRLIAETASVCYMNNVRTNIEILEKNRIDLKKNMLPFLFQISL